MPIRPHFCAAFVAALLLTAATACAQQNTDASLQDHIQRANQFLAAKQPAQAIPELQAVIAASPDNLDAQANLGVLFYFEGKPQLAEEHLRKAVELDAHQPRIQALYGLCEYRLGNSALALTNMAAAFDGLSAGSFQKEVGLLIVQLYVSQQKLSEASAMIAKLRLANPADVEVEYAAYRIYSDLAGEALLSLSLTHPDSGQMQQAMAHEMVRVRNLTDATDRFHRAIAINPNLPGIHLELAEAQRISSSEEEKKQAEHEYQIALEKNPAEVLAATRLGDYCADRGEYDKALKFYQQALAVDVANADAQLGLARVSEEKGDLAKAQEILLRIVQADPWNETAHYKLMGVDRHLNQQDAARQELAEYKKIKEMKAHLQTLYKAMRIEPPHQAGSDASEKNDVPSKKRM